MQQFCHHVSTKSSLKNIALKHNRVLRILLKFKYLDIYSHQIYLCNIMQMTYTYQQNWAFIYLYEAEANVIFTNVTMLWTVEGWRWNTLKFAVTRQPFNKAEVLPFIRITTYINLACYNRKQKHRSVQEIKISHL